MVQQSQAMAQQDGVNQTPTSALISGGVMVQSGMLKASQDRTGMPVSTTATPARQSTMNQVDSTALGGNRKKSSNITSFVTDPNSPGSMVSSVMSTTKLGYSSPPGYNTPSNIGTPLLVCTPPSCYTPTQINYGLPSVAASMDMPPTFDLNKHSKSVSYPSLVSCNIHLAPVQSVQDNYP